MSEVNVFSRAPSTTFGELSEGLFFRLDCGGGRGSYFLKTGPSAALWIWTSAETEKLTNGPVKAGSCAHFSENAAVTPASFSASEND